MCGFILVFYSKSVPMTHCFEIFDFKSAVTLKTGFIDVVENITIR